MTASLSLSAEDLLSTTRAVRLRLDLTRPVEPEVIKRCVELACQAPTGRNRQRWDFVVVTDPGRRRALADLYRLGLRAPTQPVPYDGVDRSAGDPAAQQRMSRSAQHLFEHLHEVPALVVPTVRVVRVREPSIVHQANTWGSILPAVWSFMLAARAHGLGTAWTTPTCTTSGRPRTARHPVRDRDAGGAQPARVHDRHRLPGRAARRRG